MFVGGEKVGKHISPEHYCRNAESANRRDDASARIETRDMVFKGSSRVINGTADISFNVDLWGSSYTCLSYQFFISNRSIYLLGSSTNLQPEVFEEWLKNAALQVNYTLS